MSAARHLNGRDRRPEAIGPNVATVALDAESIEAVARRVAELLREEGTGGGELVDAAELARALGRTRDWVYRHAAELGARRLPGGRKPRLLFDLAEARQALTACSVEKAPRGGRSGTGAANRPRRRRRAKGTSVPLLPYRGQEEAP